MAPVQGDRKPGRNCRTVQRDTSGYTYGWRSVGRVARNRSRRPDMLSGSGGPRTPQSGTVMRQLAIAVAGVLAVTEIAGAAPVRQGSRATPRPPQYRS